MQPRKFTIDFPQEALDDLKCRLARTRWPTDTGNADWRYGVSREYMESFVEYWLKNYDWRAQESAMNRFDHYRVEIDGVPIHFIHRRGKGPKPIPLMLSHGWPWTFWDFSDMIEPLADPAAHGGDAADAFDVIVPSLPGWCFSSPLTKTGVGIRKTAELWRRLMREVLGYERFGAHGGDFGAGVTQAMAMLRSDDLVGIHMTRYYRPSGAKFFDAYGTRPEEYGPEEAGEWERGEQGMARNASHRTVQAKDPQSLSYGLNDSPAGLAAWLIQRRRAWSDCGGDVERAFSRDFLITTTMLYWLTGTISTSMRYYWEVANESPFPAPQRGKKVIEAPVGIGVLPHDIFTRPRIHAEEDTNLQRWIKYPRGGHFGAAEVPGMVVEDLREFFRDRLRCSPNSQ